MAKSSRQNTAQNAQNDFDALFGARQGERIVSGGFKMLAHDRITVRPQVRLTFPQVEMDELRASICALREAGNGIEGSGILQALLVAPQDDGGYRLIAGEKRFRATQAEGLPEVPCIVIPAVSEGMTRLLQLTENSLRSAPPVLEEALSIRDTMQELQLSLRDMARMMGKSKGYIESRVQLTQMDIDIQNMVSARADTLRCTRLIQSVANPTLRRSLIEAVTDEQIGEREVRRRIDQAAKPSATRQPAEPNISARAISNADNNQVSARADTPPETIDTITLNLQSAHSLLEEIKSALQNASLSSQDVPQVRQRLTALGKVVAQLKKSLP